MTLGTLGAGVLVSVTAALFVHTQHLPHGRDQRWQNGARVETDLTKPPLGV